MEPSRLSRQEVRSLLARAPDIFTNNQAQKILSLPPEVINRKLARWAKDGYIRRIRRGTYLQVPIHIEQPEDWFGDEFRLALNLWPNSYFTGWTAANHWGLTEQVFRTVTLITSDRVRLEENSTSKTRFFVKKVKKLDLAWGIEQEWRDGFKVAMAKPSRTIIDVLTFPEMGGGIQLAAEFLREYLEEFNVHELVQNAIDHASGSAKKRLGFLLELMGYENLDDLEKLSGSISKGVIPLDPAFGKSGFRIMRWNILVNTRIDLRDRT